jgi:pyrroline-5-carboxylate reductase
VGFQRQNEKRKMTRFDALIGARLSFIGCGVMAEAIIAGVLSKNLVKPEQVVGSHPREERREELQAKYGIRIFEENSEAVAYRTSNHEVPSVIDEDASSSIVLLTVKPQRLGVVLDDLKEAVQPRQLVICSGCTGSDYR